ncbi:MAG TPA: ATP-binding protein, partial [Gaiellales bacterium]
SELALTELSDSMVQSFKPVADDQGLGFSVEIGAGVPASFVTDPHRLRQVLMNLLSNAFKFTESGGVTLTMALATKGWKRENESLAQAGAVLAISVRDTGIGIRKELQSAIFEAFAQADGSTAREYGGTGLGLSISRNLVSLLGGELAVASEPGAGSTFTAYLPIDAVGSVLGAVHPPSEPVRAKVTVGRAKPTGGDRARRTAGKAFYNGSVAGTKVLIVDDDFRNIFALTALLERGKLAVVSAESGEAALAMLDTQDDIAIVLMDIMMPVMNGYDTIAAIRTRPARSELPIIAVTAKVNASERERCLAAGASDYIPKPVDTADLLVALDKWFTVARARAVKVAH